MTMTRSGARRALLAGLAGATLAGSALVATATPATASGDQHPCDEVLYIDDTTDDGLVTKPLHHVVEPLVPSPLPPNPVSDSSHNLFCMAQAQINSLSCVVPLLAPLRGTGVNACP